MPEYSWLLILLAAVVVAAILFVIFVRWLIAPMLRLIFLPRYSFRVIGKENIPKSGAAVLAANHVTWIDALFLAASCPRPGHVLANADFFRWKPLAALVRRAGMIPVPFTGPKAQRAAIVAVREALDRGELVAIFPEGQLTRNGFLGPFYRGLEVILKGRDEIPVVPVYIDNLWGSIFSFQGGRAFGKRPLGMRRVINIAYGEPMTGPSLYDVRTGILAASVDAVAKRRKPPALPDTVDPDLPAFDHPATNQPLTRSAANYDKNGAVQPGNREGSIGLPIPGVGIRVVEQDGATVHTEDAIGTLECRFPGDPAFAAVGRNGRIDRDGFVWLADGENA